MGAVSTLGSRVRLVREERGLSQDDLGTAISESQDVITRLERDVAKSVKPSVLVGIAAKLAVTVDWLLTGEGEPYIDNVGAAPSPGGGHAPPEQDLRRAATRAEQTILQQASAIETLKALLDRKDVPRMDVRPKFRLVGSKRELAQAEGAHWTEQYVAVPLLSDEAAAGNPRHVRDDQIGGYALVYSRWVRDVETTRCLRVKGDSMEPVLPDGSICAVDLAQRDPKALLKKIVAARVDDGVTIKWLQLAKEVLVLRPENREHDTIVLHPGEDEDNPIVGQVTWWWAPAP